MKKFEYLDHTADAKLVAYGNRLEESFENAALAMFNLMIDTSLIKDKVEREVELNSESLEWLLHDWLSELLYLFEVDGIIFGKFKVEDITDNNITGKAYGEYLDPGEHIIDTHVKGVTLHDLQIKRDNIWKIQLVVDT